MEKIISNKERIDNENTFYTIAMRGVVVFPDMVTHFDVAREKTVKSVESAISDGNNRLFLVTQKENTDNPDISDLYKTGVVAEIKQVLRLQNDLMKVLVKGIYKAKLIDFHDDGETYVSEIKRIPAQSRQKYDDTEIQALVRVTKDTFERYATYFPKMPKELEMSVMMQEEPEKLFEEIVFNCGIKFKDKQKMLEENSLLNRLSMLITCLSNENEVLEVEEEIHERTRQNMDKNQKEYFLREQLRIIQEQLGETENVDTLRYMTKALAIECNEDDRSRLIREIEKLSKLPPYSQEAFVIKNYLDAVFDLPWGKCSKSRISIGRAENILEKEHYGLQKVKERIIEFLAVYMLNPKMKGQIICLAGAPGIGKTSIAKSVAKAMGRKYVRISLGGVRDEADIRGHRKTYIGAMPGRIITAMQQAGTDNPLILLDEIDKLCSDIKGDPSSAMLEVLDSEQNNAFRDHFIEIPYDLSKAVFIMTANNVSAIPAPLLDRMEIIELPSYTAEEKYHIAKEHLIPKQIKEHGLKGTQLKITDEVIHDIIKYYTKEAGVRTLERVIASICRKSARKIASGELRKVTVKSENLQDLLGVHKYSADLTSQENQTGVVNGLAWTSVGGVIMPLEVLVMDGTGKMEITGSLGDVMKESSRIAVSYVRSIAVKYGINPEFYKNKDIHIHAPEGAVPKDGPSAGVTMTTALVSALSGIPVRADVAMTGEITLHGKVLPIGGLREKTMAAYKAGIKTVIIPKDNRPDLEEVDKVVKDSIEFVYAETLTEVLEKALVRD
ncbi:MAG: endopeptidase La [Ruminococcus sp.]|nr:endopeptidase La [Ruminococcus sp.]